MDEVLIENWNRVVGPTDYVTHLGDFAWKDPQKYVARLNGHIRLVLGNHDRRGPAMRAGFENVWEVKLTQVNNRPMFLFHYPCISWPSKSYKSWHLFGHVHGRLRGKTPSYSLDVGVDAHEYRPISFDEIKTLIEHE